jgi:hypothetical protein
MHFFHQKPGVEQEASVERQIAHRFDQIDLVFDSVEGEQRMHVEHEGGLMNMNSFSPNITIISLNAFKDAHLPESRRTKWSGRSRYGMSTATVCCAHFATSSHRV